MDEALRFFKTYETIIYLGLGGLAIWQIRKFILAWDEVRNAAFGLERESAQGRLNKTAILLVVIMLMATVEFTMVSFIVPAVPGATPLLTPTIDLLATPTTTLSAPVTGSEEQLIAATPLPVAAEAELDSGCIPDQVMINQPANGDSVSGQITLMGTVDIPNFGFYKYEVTRPGESIWLPIQAGREIKHDEPLGDWDTGVLPQGAYLLRLVVSDNQGNDAATCVIQVNVTTPGDGS
jgi:hypothetical protein